MFISKSTMAKFVAGKLILEKASWSLSYGRPDIVAEVDTTVQVRENYC